MSRRATYVAVILPLVAVALGVVRAELSLQRSRDFLFEVAGYDPRDLLRGRYLQFQLRVNVLGGPTCRENAEDCCVCLLGTADTGLAVVTHAPCETARTTCDGALSLQYVRQAHRLYVPEARAPELERRLLDAVASRTAHAIIAIDRKGGAIVRELRINGRSILE